MSNDPVCGCPIDEKKATAKSTYEGRQYVFCGKDCKEAFDQDPERYVLGQVPANTME